MKGNSANEVRHTHGAKYVAEFVGTFFLVFTIGCNVHTGSIGAAISIGSMLMVMIYSLGSVSGAHFNPAVSFAVALSGRNKITVVDMMCYMLSQVLGGIAGALSYWFLLDKAFTVQPVGMYSIETAVCAEILYTAALCYVVLNVATTSGEHGDTPNAFFGLAIGFTVTASAICIGPISGCSLNPAVSIGSVVAAFWSHGRGALKFWAAYVFGPMVGGALGSAAFFCVQGGITGRYEYANKDSLSPTASVRTREVNLRKVSMKPQKSLTLSNSDVVELPEEALSHDLFCGLQWEIKTSTGGMVLPVDIDVACAKFDKNGKCGPQDAIYFTQKEDKVNNIRLSGDVAVGNVSGAEGNVDSERILFKLKDVKPKVHALVFSVTVFTKDKSFADVKGCKVRLGDSTDEGVEYFSFDLTEVGSKNCLIAGVLYRSGSTWRFKPVDQGFAIPDARSWRHFERQQQEVVMKETMNQ